MSKHTPEPWEAIHQRGLLDIIVNGEEAVVVCTSVTPANARRILACVNACAGMSNDLLENIAITGGMLTRFAGLNETEQQLDELAQAAENYLDRSICLNRFDDGFSAMKAREALIDLIEKARGQHANT